MIPYETPERTQGPKGSQGPDKPSASPHGSPRGARPAGIARRYPVLSADAVLRPYRRVPQHVGRPAPMVAVAVAVAVGLGLLGAALVFVAKGGW